MARLVFGVVGDPVAHSRSPAMHGAAYTALGLPHVYLPVRARTQDQLAEVVGQLRDGRLAGLNVTVPHKQTVLSMVDGIDRSAALVGAANTLVCRGGKLIACNTDTQALAEELAALAPELDGEGWATVGALVLGAGGAARAAVIALGSSLGVRAIEIRARSLEDEPRARTLRAELEGSLPSTALTLSPWRASPSSERRVSVIVQATSAGMDGSDPGEAVADAIAWDALAPSVVALDVVYAPPETPFLRAALGAQLRAVNGLGMLARQGALAFELWLGVPAPLAAMRAALGR